jgi:hypothetical protein
VDIPVDFLDGKDETLSHPVAPHGNTEGKRYHVHHLRWEQMKKE